MTIRNIKPLAFSPHGITDAYDESDSFPGACRKLVNLMLDSSNPDQVVARPGVSLPLTSFAGFATPGFISIQVTVGSFTYGMVASSRTVGCDEPFVYNNANGLFVAITGVTAGNVPTSPAISGTWVPPTISVIAKKVIITHPGFSGIGSNFFGVLDISNPAAPTWAATNTTTNALPSVPTSVANYNNRAYYACGNLLYFSDSLNPTVITNATQALTIGDTTAIVAQSGLPIQTTSSGVAAALIVFKAGQVWQITGDTVGGTLADNFISLTVGCAAPRSVVQTPIGIIFISQDTPCVLNLNGVIQELRHPSNAAADLRAPFVNSTDPTRIAAAFSGSIYRICVPTMLDGSPQTNDYWFDLRRMRWTGPHSFLYDCASQYNDEFILSGAGIGAALFASASNDVTLNTIYNDNGAPLLSNMQTTFLGGDGGMEFKQMIESDLDLTSGGVSVAFTISATDDRDSSLGAAIVTTPAPSSVWGGFTWGDGTLYSPTKHSPHRYDVGWNVPVVWDRMSLNISAVSSSDVSIGKFKGHYQSCGYALRPFTYVGVIIPPPVYVGNQLDVNFILNESILA